MSVVSDKFLSSSDNDIPMLATLLENGQISGTADVVAEYELALAQRFGSKHAVAVSSGSTAIQAALQAIDAKPGAEVLVPATAPLPSVFPITANGLIPVAVDVLPSAVGFDPNDLAKKISARTCAALSVPLWGYPIDLSSTTEILADANLPLIEDAAHAHGAAVGDRKVGTTGLIGCFSTHDRKLLATGEGGFILTDDDAIADKMRAYTRLGNLTGERPGVNYKLNAMAAAIGLARLPLLDDFIARRTRNARHILSSLGERSSYVEISYPGAGSPNYYNATLVLQGETDVAKKRLQVLSNSGLAIDQIKYGYNVFYRREAYRHLQASCPNAEDLVERLVQLPVHPGLTAVDLNRVVEILREIL